MGIFVKRCAMLLHDVAVPVEGRVVVATASVIGGASFTLASLYLLTGGRICDFNADALARTAAEVGVRGRSYAIGGDFQVSPGVLEQTGFVQRLGGARICAPAGGAASLGTCLSGPGASRSSVLG